MSNQLTSQQSKEITWFDVRPYLKRGCTFNFFIGGRGIGKTYSSVAHIHLLPSKSIYVRNTDIQIKACMSPMGNPFKKYNSNEHTDLRVESDGVYNTLYDATGIDLKKDWRKFGYAFSLSTFHNLRGIDLFDVDCIWMEEFIQDTRLTYDQFLAFCRMYETVNRDREMEGYTPTQVIFTSNSQSLASPILSGFGLVPIVEKMDRKRQEVYQKGDFLIVRPAMREFMEDKRKTVLYRNIEGTAAFGEAIDNEFANDSFFNVGHKPLKEYRILCALDDMYIYTHKHNQTVYVCRSRGNCTEFSSRDTLILFMRTYGFMLRDKIARGEVYFSEFLLKSKLLSVLKI